MDPAFPAGDNIVCEVVGDTLVLRVDLSLGEVAPTIGGVGKCTPGRSQSVLDCATDSQRAYFDAPFLWRLLTATNQGRSTPLTATAAAGFVSKHLQTE
jgi:hypothetical protein